MYNYCKKKIKKINFDQRKQSLNYKIQTVQNKMPDFTFDCNYLLMHTIITK